MSGRKLSKKARERRGRRGGAVISSLLKGTMRMEWINRLNDALAYLEANLDRDIDLDRAAQLAACSTFHFQRMFTYIAGIPLGEYLRRRRMTLAALELTAGDARVIDLALKYGYESPSFAA